MRWLLVDENSLGYDLSDFEAVAAFVRSRPNAIHFIFTRSTNITLFAESLSGPNVHYLGYPKRKPGPHDRLAELSQALGVDPVNVRRFSDLPQYVADAKLIGKRLAPSGRGYFNVSAELVASYEDELRTIAARCTTQRVALAIVSGVKALSDVGRTLAQQQEEGRRQSFPWSHVATTVARLQQHVAPFDCSILPLSVQYGLRAGVRRETTDASTLSGLSPAIEVFDSVEWTDAVEQQAAFYVAAKQFAESQQLPLVVIGNASTYLHLLLGVLGTPGAVAVGLHSYPVGDPRDGRAYWETVAEQLPDFWAFRQQSAGDWGSVATAIADQLSELLVKRLTTTTS